MCRRLSYIWVAALLACNAAVLKSSPDTGDGDADDDAFGPDEEEAPDGGTRRPISRRDAAAGDPPVPAPVVDSGCPAPARITPTDLPAGFLPAMKVTVSRVIDGDSGEFHFPTAQGQPVRMLYVNTEESGGAEMTPFGVETKGVVQAWFRAATDIRIAVQESYAGSGMPKLDPYDRWLSLVFLDGELLQTRIVREGLSAYYTTFGCADAPVHDALLYAEAEANARDRGIWGPGAHNDYEQVLRQWIGRRTCRPNPFLAPYC